MYSLRSCARGPYIRLRSSAHFLQDSNITMKINHLLDAVEMVNLY